MTVHNSDQMQLLCSSICTYNATCRSLITLAVFVFLFSAWLADSSAHEASRLLFL